MEQRKSDINTGDGNVINVDNNGLNYSFDFSNQVTPDSTQISGSEVNVQPVPQASSQPAVSTQMVDNSFQQGQSMPEVNPTPEVNVGPMPMPNVTPNAAGPVVGPQVSVPNGASPMSSPSVEATPVSNGTVQSNPVNASVLSTNDQTNGVQGEQAVSNEGVQSEVQNTQQVQDSGEEIIKDKKSTKVFLFTIVAIIVAFIIALPFIRNILG